MRTRYIANPLAPDGYLAAPIVGDPIFTPLFASIGLSTVGISALGGISAAGLASAIAAIGGYKEFPL